MHRDGHVVLIRHVGDLSRLTHPADLREVRRDDVDRLIFDESPKLGHAVAVLADRDRRHGRLRHRLLDREVLRWHGVFEPPDVVLLNGGCESLRGTTGERPVTVEGDVGDVPNPLRHCLDDLGFVPDLARTEVSVRAILLESAGNVEVELERVVAELLDDPFGLVRARFGVGFFFGVTVTVDAHSIAVLSTEQLVRGHPEELPREVV